MKHFDKPISKEDRERLLVELRAILDQIQVARNRHIHAVIVGVTGAGKSTALTQLVGGNLVRKPKDPEDYDPRRDGPIEDLPEDEIMFVEEVAPGGTPIAPIGENIAESHTLKPSLVEDKKNQMFIFDSAGFLENRSKIDKLLAALGLRLTIRAIKNLSTVMVAIPFNSIKEGKGGTFLQLLTNLRNIIKSSDMFSAKKNSTGPAMIFVITKIPKDRGWLDIKRAIARLKKSLQTTNIYTKAHNTFGQLDLSKLTDAERDAYGQIEQQLEIITLMENDDAIFPLYLEDKRVSAEKILQHLRKRQEIFIPREEFNLKEAGDAQLELIRLLEYIADKPALSFTSADGQSKKQAEMLKQYLQLNRNRVTLQREQFGLLSDLKITQEELDAAKDSNFQQRLDDIIKNRTEQITRKKNEFAKAQKSLTAMTQKKEELEAEHQLITSEALVPGWVDSVDEPRWFPLLAPLGWTLKNFIYNNSVGMPYDKIEKTCENGDFDTVIENSEKTSFSATYRSKLRYDGKARVEVLFKANRLESNKVRAGIIQQQDLPNVTNEIELQKEVINKLPAEIKDLERELSNAKKGTFPATQARLLQLEVMLKENREKYENLSPQLGSYSKELVENLRDYYLVLTIAECIDFSGAGYLQDFVRDLNELIDSFYCPISQELMDVPVVLTACGHIVNEEQMLKWLETQRNLSDCCTVCRTPIGPGGWIPADDGFKSLIQTYSKITKVELSPMPSIRGLKRHYIQRDGHCLFRSVLRQLSSNPLNQVDISSLRDRVADIMERYADLFQNFPDGSEQSFAERIAQIRSSNAWGGHIEIAIMAHIFHRRIIVLQPDKPTHVFGSAEVPHIYLLYNGTHYDAATLLENVTDQNIMEVIRQTGLIIDHGQLNVNYAASSSSNSNENRNRGSVINQHFLLPGPRNPIQAQAPEQIQPNHAMAMPNIAAERVDDDGPEDEFEFVENSPRNA